MKNMLNHKTTMKQCMKKNEFLWQYYEKILQYKADRQQSQLCKQANVSFQFNNVIVDRENNRKLCGPNGTKLCELVEQLLLIENIETAEHLKISKIFEERMIIIKVMFKVKLETKNFFCRTRSPKFFNTNGKTTFQPQCECNANFEKVKIFNLLLRNLKQSQFLL